MFPKTKAKRDFCARESSAEKAKKRIPYLRSRIFDPGSIYCYRIFLFHFLWKAWQIFPVAAVP